MGLGSCLYFLLACAGAAGETPGPATPGPAPAAIGGLPAAVAGAGQTVRERSDPSEILVIGQRPRGTVAGNVPPEIQLDEEDIASHGAATVAELVDALAPQTSSGSGAGRPVVLVNGRRISSFAEIRDLPPEALERVDILPPEVALRYGYRSDQRVVNLVLRPRYRSIIGEAARGFATEGGRGAYQGNFSIARIGPRGRWNVRATYQRTDALLESERDIDGGQGRFRSLLPSAEEVSLNGTITREVSDNVTATLNGRVETRSGRTRIGPSIETNVPAPSQNIPARPLIRDSQSRTAHAGASASGSHAGWQWLFTGSYSHLWSIVRTDIPNNDRPAIPGARGRDHARYSGWSAEAQLLVHGAIAALPAGEAQASFRTGWERQAYSSRTRLAGLSRQARLSRSQGNVQATLDIPLLGGGNTALASLGDLSANLDLEANEVSDFGTLRRVSYGGRWAPIPQLSFMASIAHEDSAPTVQNLGEPAVLTPNVRVFDFTRGETVDISRLVGGNPGLLQENRRRVRLGLSLRPLPRTNLTITATYTASRTRNPVGFFPAPTAELEAAFPERFVRDAAGRLLRIDTRPVNFARSEREELRWGGNLALPLRRPLPPHEDDNGPPPRQGAGRIPDNFDLRRLAESESERRGRLQFALYHSWRFRDQILVRPGLPRLDFLNGSAIGSRGGRPRHELEFQADLFQGVYGARLDATWESGTRVGTLAGPAGMSPRALSFSSQARVNLRLFANLGEQRMLVRRAPWLRGARVSLDIDNIFNSRPRVRDESRATPLGLQPDYLDPVGRSVRLTLRKLF